MENTNPKRKYIAGIVIAVLTLLTTYLVHTNPDLNLADLTNTTTTVNAEVDVYMPTYEGGIGETGEIEIKAKEDIISMDSITFVMNFTPVNGLIFDNNPIVFDADTEFQNSAFQITSNQEDGKLIVTIVLEDPISVDVPDPLDPDTHLTLFKLDTQINPSLPEGEVVDITFEDFAILDGVNAVAIADMPASTITVAGQDELKAVSAEAIDNTHVAVTFSDFIADFGTTTDYDFTPGLTVNNVESGTGYGYDQKTVILTTDPQVVTEYVITIDPTTNVTSNQQGSVDPVFDNVVFFGFGSDAGVLSDFGMSSATVTGYTTINVNFTDDVELASVTKSDFELEEVGGAAIPIDSVNNINGSMVTLAVSTPLLSENTYVVKAVTADAINRDSDSADLGMDRVSFTGAKNGPRLLSATVTDQGGGAYRLQMTFDEEIELGSGGVNDEVGILYNPTEAGAGTLIDNFNIGVYNQSISGTTLTLENAVFNNADTNFTFAVSDPTWLENSLGVPIEDTYSAISFWGLGHNNAVNSVGNVDVSKKDALVIPGNGFDFAVENVQLADVTVLYDDGAGTLVTQAITGVNEVNGDLHVAMTASLDPDRHYVVTIENNANEVVVSEDFVVQRLLNVNSATPVTDEKVEVFFSENIDERDVDAGDFELTDSDDIAIAITDFEINTETYKSVFLDTGASNFSAGNIFRATVTGVNDLYSFDGDAVSLTTGFFTGFGTVAAGSAVVLNTVETIDAQTLRLTFSDNLDFGTFTPVNLDIFWLSDAVTKNDLVVTNINQVSSTIYELKTAIQDSNQNYFITFDGVTDEDGLLLGNTSPKTFFGFQLPEAQINLVTPSVISNELEANIIISGQNLDLVSEIRLSNTVMTISSQSSTSLVFTVPADFTADLYNITLVDTADNLIKFDDALLITVPDVMLTVHSNQSQAIPLNVINDGETPTTLWLLVEDPVGLSSISSVVVDLSQIGGPSTVEMMKDTGTQPAFSQWYTYTTTVPKTVQTQNDPYLLPVEVRKGSETFDGTISVRVTKDVLKSVAPVIDQVYVTPLAVPPDNFTKLRISAQITDQDGASTITSVVADLGSLGVGFLTLTPISEVTEGTELETQFYESEEFTIPLSTPYGIQSINVIASDTSGEQTIEVVQIQVTESATTPVINADLSYISPRTSIPNDGKTEFAINVFITDLDGIDTLQSVTADFGSLGIPPVNLTKDPSATAGGFTGWFQATGLTIPKTAPFGVQDIKIVAVDNEAWFGNLILKIDVTHKDTLGEPPRIIEDRSYTTPSVAVNDGETPVSLFAFVQDEDDDIESVIVNLGSVGQVGTQGSGTMGGESASEPSDGNCPTGSDVLVCMNPSVKEGDKGQWFILPGVTVNSYTAPSAFPYQLEMVVTDSGGKTTTGNIPIYVGTGDDIADQQEVPMGLAAIPTSDTQLEILFNKEMSATSISSSGNGFTITSDTDINEKLSVISATINPAGTVVTISTANQIPGKRYVLSVSSDVKDILGRSVLAGGANRLSFEGFEALNKAPIAEYINPIDVNILEIEFRNNIRPTSVSASGIEIYESEDTSNRLSVSGAGLLEPGNTLQIKTGPQKQGVKYRVNIKGLQSYDGTTLPGSINKGFKGYNLSVARHAAAASFADLNGDGRVDFGDFTIFSSVYGTVYFGQGENVEDAAANAADQAAAANQAGQPLGDEPDATVPITSVPAGGEIVTP